MGLDLQNWRNFYVDAATERAVTQSLILESRGSIFTSTSLHWGGPLGRVVLGESRAF